MKRVSCLHLLAVLLLASVHPCTAQESPAVPAPRKAEIVPPKLPALELPVPAEALKETDQSWYGLYINGTKAGWGVETHGPDTMDGKPVVVAAMKLHMALKAQEQEMNMDFSTVWRYSAEAPQRLLFLEEKQQLNGQESRVVLKQQEGTTYSAETTEAGKARTEVLKDFDLRLTHQLSPGIWVLDAARKPGDAIGERSFSSTSMKASEQTTTLLSETEWTGPGGKLPVWECEMYDHEHSMRAVGRISRIDGDMVTAVFGGMFELRAEPEKVAKQSAEGGTLDIFQAMTIASDRKLGRSTALAELVVEITAPEGKEPPSIPDTANQTAERSADGKSITVRIGRKYGEAQPVTESERRAALEATRRYPIGDEKVKALAQQAVAGATTDKQKVEKLLRFTDNFVKDSLDSEPLTVMDLIADPRGDCSAHSLFFATLARAAGIPAREAGGWMYMGNDYNSFGGHAWNEVVLEDRWVPVDPTWAQMQTDAGHIQLHAGDSLGDSIKAFIPGLKAKVISFRKK